jgi:hypothetical protein
MLEVIIAGAGGACHLPGNINMLIVVQHLAKPSVANIYTHLTIDPCVFCTHGGLLPVSQYTLKVVIAGTHLSRNRTSCGEYFCTPETVKFCV